MAQRRYTITVPKRILEGFDDGDFIYEVLAKDTTQAINRAMTKAVESGNFDMSTIKDDWRWKRLKVKLGLM